MLQSSGKLNVKRVEELLVSGFKTLRRFGSKVSSGAILGHFKLQCEIGRGATGVVYRALDLRLERLVAVKINFLEVEPKSPAWGRLIREARLASALSHPCICTIYDVGEEDGIAYIAMEYIVGMRLSALLFPAGLPHDLVNHFGRLMSVGFAHAHERGIIHGDVKPGNMIVSRSGELKILDFGLGKRFNISPEYSPNLPSSSGIVVGTFPYLAPEVLRGERRGVWSDIWSVGVSLYELATGKLPFQGCTPFELSSRILVSDPVAPARGIAPTLSKVIHRCLQKEPHMRYHSAQEIADDLSADTLPSLLVCWRNFEASLRIC